MTEVPEGWRKEKLSDFANVTSGGTPQRSKAEYWGGDIPWITTAEIQNNVIKYSSEKITKLGLANSAAKIFTKGTILLAMYGQGKTRGQVAILGIEASTNQACAAISVNSNMCVEFIFQNLHSRYIEIRNISNDGSQKNLSAGLIKNISVLVPPLHEQRKIAEILSTWDRAIETVEKLIANAQAQKKALMQQLLTGKKRLPGFRGEWEEVKFGNILEIKIGGTPSRNNPEYWDYNKKTENLWISVSDMNRKYVLKTKEYISNDGIANSNVKRLKAGTVIMSFKLSIGKKAILKKDAYTNEAICALMPIDVNRIDRLFLYHILEVLDLEESVDQAVKGKTLNKAKISELLLPYPQINEQRKIVEILEAQDEEIEKYETSLELLKQEKTALMQQLLTGKRRVKIEQEKAA